MNEAQDLKRASDAARLLEDKEMVAAFAAVRDELLRRIEEAPIRDREAVHECKLMLKLLGDLRLNLQSVINTGKMIQARQTMLDRARKGIANVIGN